MNYLFSQVWKMFGGSATDDYTLPRQYSSLAEELEEAKSRRSIFFDSLTAAVNALSARVHDKDPKYGHAVIALYIRVDPFKKNIFWNKYDICLTSPANGVPGGYKDCLSGSELKCLETSNRVKIDSGWYAGCTMWLRITDDAVATLSFDPKTCMEVVHDNFVN